MDPPILPRPKPQARPTRLSCTEVVLIVLTVLFCTFTTFSVVYVVILIATHSNVSARGFKVRGMEAFNGGSLLFNTDKKVFDIDMLRSSFSVVSPLQYKGALFDIYFPSSDKTEVISRELMRFNKAKMFFNNNNNNSGNIDVLDSKNGNFINIIKREENNQQSTQRYSISFNDVRSGSLFTPSVQVSNISNKTIYVSSSDVKLESSNFVYKGNVVFKDKLSILNDRNEDGYDTLPQGVSTQLNIYTNYNNVGGITIDQGFQDKTKKSFDIMFPLNIGGEDGIEISYVSTTEEEEEEKEGNENSNILLTSNKKQVIASTPSTSYINSDLKDVTELRYGPFSIAGNVLSSFPGGDSCNNDNNCTEKPYLLFDIDTDVEQDLKISEINLNGAEMKSTGFSGFQTKLGFSEGTILKIDNVLDAGDIQISLNKSSKIYSVRNTATTGNDGNTSVNIDYKSVILKTINVDSILVNNALKLRENSLESLNTNGEQFSTIQIGSKMIGGKVFAAQKNLFLESIISGNIFISTDTDLFGSIVIKNVNEEDGVIGVASLNSTSFDKQVKIKRDINRNRIKLSKKGINDDNNSTFNVNGISFGVSQDNHAFLKQFSETDKITAEAKEILFQTPVLVFDDLIQFTASEINSYSQNGNINNGFMETGLLFNNYSNVVFSGVNNYNIDYIASNYKYSLTDAAQDENICVVIKGDENCVLTSMKQSLINTEITEDNYESTSSVLRFSNSLNIDKLSLSESLFLQTEHQPMISSIYNNNNNDSISLIMSKNDEDNVDTTIYATSSTKELELSFPLVFSYSDINNPANGTITVNRVEFNKQGIKNTDNSSTEQKSFSISGLVDFRVPDISENFSVSLLEQKNYVFAKEGKISGSSFLFRLLESLDEINNTDVTESPTIESCVIFDFIHFCTIIDKNTGTKSTSVFHRNYYNVFDNSGNVKDEKNLYEALFVNGGKLLINDGKDATTNNDNLLVENIKVLRSINFVNWYLKNNDNIDFYKPLGDVAEATSINLVLKNNLTISSEKPLQLSTATMYLGDSSKLKVGSLNPTTIFFEKLKDPEKSVSFHVENNKNSSPFLYIDSVLNIETNKVIFGGDENIDMEISFKEVSYNNLEDVLSADTFASIRSYFKNQSTETAKGFLGFSYGLSVNNNNINNDQDSLVQIGNISLKINSNTQNSSVSIKSTDGSLYTNSNKIFLGRNMAIDVSKGILYNFMRDEDIKT